METFPPFMTLMQFLITFEEEDNNVCSQDSQGRRDVIGGGGGWGGVKGPPLYLRKTKTRLAISLSMVFTGL